MKGAVAVFIPTIYRTGKHRYIQHLSEKLAEKGYHTYCFCTYSDLYWQEQLENNERSVFQLYERTEIKAAVIYSELIKDNKLCEKIVKNLKQKEIPVFTIERPIENAFNIVYDHAMGFGKIVDHIIEKHHAKNIYMLSGMREVSMSIGIERAVPVEAKNDLQKLVKAADEKMYLQKAARGDQRR